MALTNGNYVEPLCLSNEVELELSSEGRHDRTETRPEVVEDYKAWLYVVAGFLTYVNVS